MIMKIYFTKSLWKEKPFFCPYYCRNPNHANQIHIRSRFKLIQLKFMSMKIWFCPYLPTLSH